MHLEELKDGDSECDGIEQKLQRRPVCGRVSLVWDTKRAFVGAGARALFYPTLFYNVVRNKIQSEFRWWDRVDEYVLLGAVPFPTDVPCLKALGVGGVVTLNEPYETLVSTALYHEHDIEHLVIPTRDYLFAPSAKDVCRAVDFIHCNAMRGKTTYVHCKAGRGRSTTIVLCYLIKHKHMFPEAAFEHVRSIRPRVLLAATQRKAVQDFYNGLKNFDTTICSQNTPRAISGISSMRDLKFDDNSSVLITESDLDGYEEIPDSSLSRQRMVTEVSRVQQFASQAAISRLSCLWARQKMLKKKLNGLRSMGIDIHVY